DRSDVDVNGLQLRCLGAGASAIVSNSYEPGESYVSPGRPSGRHAPRSPATTKEASLAEYPALHMIIDGEKVSGGGRRTFDVVNPVTGEPIGALPLAETADLDRALEVAAKGFRIWRKSTPQ